MRYSSFFIACGACLCFLWALALSVDAGGACTKHRCDDCPECVPVCTPRYEDKKVKTPRYDVKCSWECVPGREPWHEDSCDPEHNPPCGDVRIKKKLYKTEIEEVEKKLVYGEVQWTHAQPCRHCEHKPCSCWHELHAACARLCFWPGFVK